jgi:hypothetical protein
MGMTPAIIEAAWESYFRRCVIITGTGYFADQKTAFAESMASIEAAALERAAKLAEDSAPNVIEDAYDAGAEKCALTIAAKIRALITKDSGGGD